MGLAAVVLWAVVVCGVSVCVCGDVEIDDVMPEIVRVHGKDFGPLIETMLEKDVVGLKLKVEQRVGVEDDELEVIDVTNLLDDGSEGSLRACLNYGIAQQKGVHCKFDYQICEDYHSVRLSQVFEFNLFGSNITEDDPHILPILVLTSFPTLIYPASITGVLCSLNGTEVYPTLVFSNPQWGLLYTNNTGPSSVTDISIVGHFTRGAVGIIRSQGVHVTSTASVNSTNATATRASAVVKPFVISDVPNSVAVAVRVSDGVVISNLNFFNSPDGIQLQRSQNVIISENNFVNLFRGVVACDFKTPETDKWFRECPIVDVSETTPGNPGCPASSGDYSVISQNITIENNYFFEISDQAIQLDRSNLVTIEHNDLTFLSRHSKSISLTYGCLNSFINNSVTDGNGALFRTQSQLKVSENVFTLTAGWAVTVANRSQNVEIYSNGFSGTRGLLVAVTEKASVLNNVFYKLDDVSVTEDDSSVECGDVTVRNLGVLRLEIPLEVEVKGNYIVNSPFGGIVVAGGTHVNVSENTVVDATTFCYAITSSPYEVQRSPTDIQIYNSICRNVKKQDVPVWGYLVTSPDTELFNIAVFNNQIHETTCGGLFIKSTEPILPFFFVFNDVFLLRQEEAMFYDLRIVNGAVTVQNNIFFSPLNTSSVTTNPGCPESDSDIDTENPTNCPHLSSLVFSNNYYATSTLTSSSLPDSDSYIGEDSPFVYDFIEDVDSIGVTARPENLTVTTSASIGVSTAGDVAGTAWDYFGNLRPFIFPSVGLFQYEIVLPPSPTPTPTPTIPPSPTPTPTPTPPPVPTFVPFPTPTPTPTPTPFFRKPTPFPTPTPTEYIVVPPIPETTQCSDLEAAQECVDAHIALTCLAYPEDPDLQCECVQDTISGVNIYDCVAIQNCLCGDQAAANEFWTTLAGNCHIHPTSISCMSKSNPGPCLASQGFQCSSTYSQLACNRLDKCSCYPDAISDEDCEAIFNCNCGSFIRSSYYWDSVASACSSDTDSLSCPILTKKRQSVDN